MKLVLKEKAFSLKERFNVTDEAERTLYTVEGKLFSWGHQLDITDVSGAHAAHIRQKVLGRLSSKSNSLKEDIEGRKPAETFAGPVVDQIKDSVKLRLRYLQKVTTLGEEETKQSIGIFIASSLPRLMRFGKEDWRFKLLLQFSKLREF